jgi:hypothetical protein
MITKLKHKHAYDRGGTVKLPESYIHVNLHKTKPTNTEQPVGEQPGVAIVSAGSGSGVSAPSMAKAGKTMVAPLRELLKDMPDSIREQALQSPKFKGKEDKVFKFTYDNQGGLIDAVPMDAGYAMGGEVKQEGNMMSEKFKVSKNEPKSPLKGLAEGGPVAAQDIPKDVTPAQPPVPQPEAAPTEPAAGSPTSKPDVVDGSEGGPLSEFAAKGVDKAAVDQGNQLFKQLAEALDADNTEEARAIISDIRKFDEQLYKTGDKATIAMCEDIKDLVSAYENMITDRGDSVEAKADRVSAKATPEPEAESEPSNSEKDKA